MSVKHAFRYFYVELPKIQRLPTELRSSFDWQNVTEDEKLIMMTMRARSPQAARRLMQQYNVTSAAELLPLLPRKRRPKLSKRLRDWLMRLEGARPTDPLIREQRRYKEQKRGHMPGHTRGLLK